MAEGEILTDRLRLRRAVESDAQAIYDRYASDREVTRYVGWPRHRTVDDTRQFLAWCEAELGRWPAAALLIESREAGALLGSTGYVFESDGCAAVGYVLARDAWGLGYATEALAGIVAAAPTLGLDRLSAVCHEDHRASQRVLEKCGFMLEATLVDHTVFPNLGPDPQTVCQYGIALQRRDPKSADGTP